MRKLEGREQQVNDKQLAELEALKKDYISVFETSAGKRILADLEKKCFLNRSTMPQDGNPQVLAFHEGMRYVVVHIKNMQVMDIERLKGLARKGE